RIAPSRMDAGVDNRVEQLPRLSSHHPGCNLQCANPGAASSQHSQATRCSLEHTSCRCQTSVRVLHLAPRGVFAATEGGALVKRVANALRRDSAVPNSAS